MNYDGLLLAAVASELREALIGGRVEKIRQPLPTDVVLQIHRHGSDYRLLLSVDAHYPRVYLTTSVPPSPRTPLNFCMLLRKYIEGAFVKEVKQANFDRVLHVHLEAPDGNRTTLIHEIMGKHSNLILINDEGRILGAAKIVTQAISRQRQVLPGRDYTPPPEGKVSPLEVTQEEFGSLMHVEADEPRPRDLLVKTFSGIGPVLANELVARTGEDAPGPDKLWEQALWLRQTISETEYSPVAITNERGKTEMVYPVPLQQFPPDRTHPRSSLSEALDTYYRRGMAEAGLEAERSHLLADVKRALSARERSLSDLRQAIAEAENADQYKAQGDLIIASMGQIPKGAVSVRLVNYYDPNLAETDIALDPTLGPRENAERYFRKYRKARDGAAAAADRLAETQEEIYDLKAIGPEIDAADSVDALREVRSKLTAKGLIRAAQAALTGAKAAARPFGGARIQRTTSREGWEILYGENSLANDHLTTKVAAPNDLWFHARSIKGAHVVIRTNNKPGNVSPGTLRQAAEIAAANSDAKHSSLVPVDYTLRKFVRKPRGSAPGFVTYQNEKTIDVTPNG